MSIIRITFDDAEATSRKGGLVQHAVIRHAGGFPASRVVGFSKVLYRGMRTRLGKSRTAHTAFR